MQMQRAGGAVEQAGQWSVTVTPARGATETRTTVTPSLSSQTLVAANTNRLGLRIVFTTTDPTQRLWIKAGSPATSTDYFTQVVGQEEFELFNTHPYSGLFSVISNATTGTIQVIELTP